MTVAQTRPAPETPGRAGLVSVVTAPSMDLAAFHAFGRENLARHAQPTVLRFRDLIEKTATLKPRKAALQKEEFNPDGQGDPRFWDPGA